MQCFVQIDCEKQCCTLLAIEMKACIVGGGWWWKSLLIDPGSELHLGREKEDENVRR